MPYTYKGETTTIPAVTGDFCPACGEAVLNREHGDRYSELLGLFQRQVNAAYVDPKYIAKVRKKLRAREEENDLAGWAGRLSAPSFARVWDNPEDADYDNLAAG